MDHSVSRKRRRELLENLRGKRRRKKKREKVHTDNKTYDEAKREHKLLRKLRFLQVPVESNAAGNRGWWEEEAVEGEGRVKEAQGVCKDQIGCVDEQGSPEDLRKHGQG